MAHKLVRGRKAYCAVLLLAVVLSSCSYYPEPARILTLPTLQGPGLKKLALFSNLHPSAFYSFTIAQTSGQSSPLVFITIGSQLYVSRLDGSGQHALNLEPWGCLDPSFSKDLRWVACSDMSELNNNIQQVSTIQFAGLRNPANIQAYDVHDVDLSAFDTSVSGADVSNPYFSPDGKMLAVFNGIAQTTHLYRATPPYRTFSLLATLGYSQTGRESTHPSDWWSPDGRYFLLPQADDWYRIPVEDLPNLSDAPLPHSDMFASFVQEAIGDLTWGPTANEITYVVRDDTTGFYGVRIVNILTGQQRTLFSLSSFSTSGGSFDTPIRLSNLAWTPDDHQLLFTIESADPCVDCNAYFQAEIYSYTPSDGSSGGHPT